MKPQKAQPLKAEPPSDFWMNIYDPRKCNGSPTILGDSRFTTQDKAKKVAGPGCTGQIHVFRVHPDTWSTEFYPQ